MLTVISPAKTLDYETPSTTADFTMPAYLELMGISAKLGDLNFGRYLNWQPKFTTSNAKQALLAFKGDVYTGLAAESLSEADLQWAQQHLRILSGL